MVALTVGTERLFGTAIWRKLQAGSLSFFRYAQPRPKAKLNCCIVPYRQAGTRLLTLAVSEARALVGPSAKTGIAPE
jgi:hypothetical protein